MNKIMLDEIDAELLELENKRIELLAKKRAKIVELNKIDNENFIKEYKRVEIIFDEKFKEIICILDEIKKLSDESGIPYREPEKIGNSAYIPFSLIKNFPNVEFSVVENYFTSFIPNEIGHYYEP